MIVYQYRELDKNMKIDYDTNSYEMIIPEDECNEVIEGFNHKGMLLLKDITDKIEYHLYDNSIPISYDLNDTLDKYYKTYCNIYLYIKNITDKKSKPLNQTGRLHKKTINGVVKYFINDIDIEEFLFNNTEQNVHIKIKRIDIASEEGDNEKNEPREDKEKNNKSS